MRRSDLARVAAEWALIFWLLARRQINADRREALAGSPTRVPGRGYLAAARAASMITHVAQLFCTDIPDDGGMHAGRVSAAVADPAGAEGVARREAVEGAGGCRRLCERVGVVAGVQGAGGSYAQGVEGACPCPAPA